MIGLVTVAALSTASLGQPRVLADGPVVTNLHAEHHGGQTFITFDETSATAEYDVYRGASPILALSGLKPVAHLAADSSVFRYTGGHFVICDLCPPLGDDKGLLVWTPSEDGLAYYAVKVAGASSFATVSVQEKHEQYPGAVLQSAPRPASMNFSRRYRYFAWEDYSAWRTEAWGYYGHEFDVYEPLTSNSYVTVRAPYPIVVPLHSAGDIGYRAIPEYSAIPTGVLIFVNDNFFANDAGRYQDPYIHGARNYTFWFGYYDPVLRAARPVTEERIVRYIKLLEGGGLRTQSGERWAVDPNRVYLTGASLGSWGMHFASHYPDVFAAGSFALGTPAGVDWGDWSRFGDLGRTKVISAGNAANSLPVRDAEDVSYMARVVSLPPMIHTFNKDDKTVSPASYQAALRGLEAARQPYAAEWRNGNHTQFVIVNGRPNEPWDVQRFRRDEAYPAFGGASSSDDAGAGEGQRNARLDWSSALHSLGPAASLVDLADRLEITLKSLTAESATADVTIRNAQRFRPPAGTNVTWQVFSPPSDAAVDSGTTRADAAGLVTVRVPVKPTGSRLVLRR